VAWVCLAPLLWSSGCNRNRRSSALDAELDRISLAVRDAGNAGASYVTVQSRWGTYNIVELTFRGGGTGDADLKRLESLTPIIGIDLSGTKVTDGGMATIQSLHNLEYLQLSGTSVSDDGLARLVGLERLEAIDLSHTKVTQSGAKYLAALPCLKNIYAVGTGLEDVPGKHLDRTETPSGWMRSWAFDHDPERPGKPPPQGQVIAR
jgi:hypothetical protein